MHKFTLLSGIIFSALSVIIGAFGAHSLNSILISNGRTDTFETAVKYQIFHSLALLFVGLLQFKIHSIMLNWSVYMFILGIIIFSGSLYALSITNMKWLGAVTPIGGIAFIAGWIMLFIVILKQKI